MLLANNNLCTSPLKPLNEVKTVSKNKQYFLKQNDFYPLVLIVEDDADTRLMLKYLLEIWKYRVIEAYTGEEALEMTYSQNPDVILMDYKLPKINGITTTERIREFPNHKDTVIIFVSAYSDEKIRDSVLASGANEYLVKPINFGNLETSLERHLKNNRNIERAENDL